MLKIEVFIVNPDGNIYWKEVDEYNFFMYQIISFNKLLLYEMPLLHVIRIAEKPFFF